jgi:GNAT superfamily N-acetyltransferase
MPLRLEKASIDTVDQIHQLQVEAFLPLLEKYRDHETNPANDSIGRIVQRLEQPQTTYYFIVLDTSRIGAIRVVFDAVRRRARISPMFIAPPYQGQGYGQEALALVEAAVDADMWELDTILEEKGNCHFYEKVGYKRVGGTRAINEKMTIVSYAK